MKIRLFDVTFDRCQWGNHTETVSANNAKEAITKAVKIAKGTYRRISLHTVIKVELLGETEN